LQKCNPLTALRFLIKAKHFQLLGFNFSGVFPLGFLTCVQVSCKIQVWILPRSERLT
jgi:hypothetical protein